MIGEHSAVAVRRSSGTNGIGSTCIRIEPGNARRICPALGPLETALLLGYLACGSAAGVAVAAAPSGGGLWRGAGHQVHRHLLDGRNPCVVPWLDAVLQERSPHLGGRRRGADPGHPGHSRALGEGNADTPALPPYRPWRTAVLVLGRRRSADVAEVVGAWVVRLIADSVVVPQTAHSALF